MSSADREYRAFLRSRWPARARRLGAYAAAGNLVFLAFDLVFARWVAEPPGAARIVAFRLPWVLLPVIGGLAGRVAALRPALPAIVVSFSVGWTWGNDWALFALGLGGTVHQALFVLISSITAATFLPIAFAGRVGVLALFWIGHVALDLLWPSGPGLTVRMWTDAAILTAVAVHAVVYENLSVSQRRGILLRRDLERTVEDLAASRRRLAESVEAVRHLASSVAHEVNNPLAAVKANLRWLGDQTGGQDEERAEVVRDGLAAIERIQRIVENLRRQARAHQSGPEPGPPGGEKG